MHFIFHLNVGLNRSYSVFIKPHCRQFCLSSCKDHILCINKLTKKQVIEFIHTIGSCSERSTFDWQFFNKKHSHACKYAETNIKRTSKRPLLMCSKRHIFYPFLCLWFLWFFLIVCPLWLQQHLKVRRHQRKMYDKDMTFMFSFLKSYYALNQQTHSLTRM